MWSTIWHTFFFDPVYNSLVFFIDVLPGGDVGLAIVCTVVFIKVVILPLSIKVTKMQAVMRELDDLGLAGIVAVGVPEEGLGRAINDRLRRAATADA